MSEVEQSTKTSFLYFFVFFVLRSFTTNFTDEQDFRVRDSPLDTLCCYF
jgi:hypothetical protein